MSTDRILLGRIGAAHGIKGEVRITPFTQYAEDIASYGPLTTDRAGLTIEIAEVRAQKTVLVARLKGIADRNQAERLNGVSLFIDRAALPAPEDEDEYYHADLIGLEARREDGSVIGEVLSLPNYGAGDLIEIRDIQSSDTYLYPFTKAVVPEINLKGGYLTIIVPLDAPVGEEEPD
ncbi:ribosome maturation factor RimM [Devosia pacifica]|uniref:Ribosome maturation factor RimM n=1 Tax=Devosia pacifica TaxID=1335967 RepID=A0A918S6L9_9HYPH|nr:ribosome maturation factor RimM [Devosia pacifica]GHA23688.1 ribosome maturation factor RimM [Devosia pacifica]